MTADNPAAPDVPAGAGPVAVAEAVLAAERCVDMHGHVATDGVPPCSACRSWAKHVAGLLPLKRLVPCARCGTRTVYRERVGDLTCCDTCAVVVGAEKARADQATGLQVDTGPGGAGQSTNPRPSHTPTADPADGLSERNARYVWESQLALRAAATIGERSCRDGDHLNYANHDRLVAEADELRAILSAARQRPTAPPEDRVTAVEHRLFGNVCVCGEWAAGCGHDIPEQWRQHANAAREDNGGAGVS